MIAKKLLGTTCLVAAALAMGVLPAWAQETTGTPTPPAQIADVDGLAFLGDVSGLPAWSTPNTDFIWLQTPDDGLAAAFVYDADGKDVGSALVGKEPLPIATLIAPSGQQIAVSPDDLGIAPPAPKPIASMVENDDGTIDFELPQDAIGVATETLETLPEEVRTQLLIDLVNRLKPVTTAEDYKAAIAGWQDAAVALARNAAPTDEPAAATVLPQAGDAASTPAADDAAPEADTGEDEAAADDAAAYTGPEIVLMPPLADGPTATDMTQTAEDEVTAPVDAPEPAPAAANTADAPASDVVTPAEAGDAAAAPSDTGEDDQTQLLDFSRTSTFWFSVGDRAAPVVYAYMDPMCPYCARSVAALKPAIDAGELQLRVILTPLISKESPDVIAGILSTENAMESFMAHEAALAAGTESPVDKVPFADLPAEIADGLRTNYKVVIDARLPEIPFFAYATAAGPKYLSGEQTENVFKDALPEPATATE